MTGALHFRHALLAIIANNILLGHLAAACLVAFGLAALYSLAEHFERKQQ
jgi:hypothetical protein